MKLSASVCFAALAATSFAAPVQGIVGIHDHFTDPDQYLDRIEAAGQRGWVTTAIGIGDNPANMSGDNFNNVASRGHTVICRLNYGFFDPGNLPATGTLPRPSRYDEFATRCANFAAATATNMGFSLNTPLYWQIGNETDVQSEWAWESSTNRYVYITPEDYANCYRQVTNAIKAVRPVDVVLPQALSPYAGPLPATNFAGVPVDALPLNWFEYNYRMLSAIAASGPLDGLSFHAGSRGYGFGTASDINRIQAGGPAGLNLPFGSDNIEEWLMYATPPAVWGLPAYITESNGLTYWDGTGPGAEPSFTTVPVYQAGYLQALFGRVNSWNQSTHRSGLPVYQCVNLYRWAPFDGWGLEGFATGNVTQQGIYNQIINTDLPASLGSGYRAPFPSLAPTFTLPAGSNVAINATVAADSQFDASRAPSRAVDGVVSTANQWTSTDTTLAHWLRVDLGSPRPVTGFRVHHASDGVESAGLNTRLFRVESADSASGPWRVEAAVYNYVYPSGSSLPITNIAFPSARLLQHLRLWITDPGNDNFTRILEFEVMANTSPTEQIIDNADANATPGPGWTRLTLDSTKWGPDYYALTAGGPPSSFIWRPVLSAWTYEVQALFPVAPAPGNVNDAHFVIHHANGVSTRIMDEENGGGMWHTIGLFTFADGDDGYVELTSQSAQTGDSIVADAIRFRPLDAASAAHSWEMYR